MFIIEQVQGKLITKFLSTFKKTLFLAYFWLISPIFFFFLVFFQKLWLCNAQLHKGFQNHAKIHRNLMIQSQENTQSDGSKDEQILFHRILARGLTSTTAVDWYFKKSKIQSTILVSIQKITSIHILILKIQQI